MARLHYALVQANRDGSLCLSISSVEKGGIVPPSNGAMRAANAAERAMNAAGWDWINAKDHLAEIIDRETKLPGLIAALTHISQAQACGDYTKDLQTLEGCVAIAYRALASIE